MSKLGGEFVIHMLHLYDYRFSVEEETERNKIFKFIAKGYMETHKNKKELTFFEVEDLNLEKY